MLVLGWLLRTILTHVLAKDLEVFKAKLTAEAASASENLRARFELAAKEHEARFSVLHQRRAEVIADLYGQLEHAHTRAKLLKRL